MAYYFPRVTVSAPGQDGYGGYATVSDGGTTYSTKTGGSNEYVSYAPESRDATSSGTSFSFAAYPYVGYRFKGWKESRTSKSIISTANPYAVTYTNTASSGGVKAHAVFEAMANVTVTFVDRGTTISSVSVKYGGSVKSTDVPSSLSRTGYDFDGWNGSYENVTANTTVTAKWKAKTYYLSLYVYDKISSVYFSVNGGAYTQTSVSMAEPVPYDATWKAYAVAESGYTPSAGSSNPAKGTIAGNTSFSPTATANTYYVKFNANGGTGAMNDETFTYGTAKALTANAFTKTGYTFAGWAETAGGAVRYADKASVSTLTTSANGVVNLYAKWTAEVHKLKISIGTGVASVKYKIGSGSEVTITASADINVPYDTNWQITDVTAKGGYVITSATSKPAVKMGTSDVSFSATATGKEYDLYVDPNGGIYKGSTSLVKLTGTTKMKVGTSRWCRIGTSSRTGYVLTGYLEHFKESELDRSDIAWDSNGRNTGLDGFWSKAHGSSTSDGGILVLSEITSETALVAQAQWQMGRYKMTAELDAVSAAVVQASGANLSVSGSADADGKYAFGSNVTYNAAQDVGEYVFHGWYYENGTLASTDASFTMAVPGADTKLVAKYSAKVTVRQVGKDLPTGANNLVYVNGVEYATDAETRVVLGGSVAINAYADNCAFSGWYTYNASATSYDDYDPLPYEQSHTMTVTGTLSLVAYFRDKSKIIYVAFTNKDITPSESSDGGGHLAGATAPVLEDSLAKLVLTGDAEEMERSKFVSESNCGDDNAPASGLFVKFDSVSRFSLSATQKTEGKPFCRIRRRGLKESTFKTVSSQSVYSGIAYANSVYEIDWGVPAKIQVSVSCSQSDGEVHIVGETSWSSSGASIKVESLSDVTIYANAKNGKKFVKWVNGDVEFSTSQRLTFAPSAATSLTAVFADDEFCVRQWEGSEEFKTLHWRSKRYTMPKPMNPVGARVDAVGYPVKLTVDMFSAPDNNTHFPTPSSERAIGSRTCEITFGSQDARRLKTMRPERYLEVDIVADTEVDAAFVGASMGGMAT